ncbi:MAG: hypothetical protein K2Q23_01250 [Bryobacteraceae bacterium]|nr:hypothetical protein [Bryobacteraceae bacterium]
MIGFLLSASCAVLSLFLGLDLFRGLALEWICVGLMAAALGAFAWNSRRMSLRALLPSWGFMALFLLNYPVQYFATQALAATEYGALLLRLLTLRAVWGQEDLRQESLRLMTIALCVLSLVLTSYALWRQSRERTGAGGFDLRAWCRQIEQLGKPERRLAGILLLIGLVVAGMALPVQIRFGIGNLTNTQAVDFRLGGVLYHLLITFVPLVLLSAHLRAMLSGSRALAVAAMAAYLLLAAVEGILMSSRGYLALRMVEICLLYFCAGRTWRMAGGWLLAGVGAALVFYPLVTSIRETRSGQGLSVSESLAEAWRSNERTDRVESVLLAASRFIGFSSLLVSVSYAGDEFSWETLEPERVLTLRESGFTRWFTERVAGYGVGVRGHFSAPGLMGAGWLLGGAVLAILGPTLLAFVAQGLYDRPGWLSRTLGPVAPVAMLETALMFFNEGTIDISLTRMAMTALALVALAILVRVLHGTQQTEAVA